MMALNPLPPDAEVIQAYIDGATIYGLARLYHVDSPRIARIIDAAGLTGHAHLRAQRRRRGQRQLIQLKPGALASAVTPEQWAYIAGFFDAEGSVYTLRSADGVVRASRLTLTQKEPEVLLWVRDTLGAGIVRVGSAPRAVHPWFSWALTRRVQIFAFLCGVRPFTIVRRAKIEAMGQALSADYGWEWARGDG